MHVTSGTGDKHFFVDQKHHYQRYNYTHMLYLASGYFLQQIMNWTLTHVYSYMLAAREHEAQINS